MTDDRDDKPDNVIVFPSVKEMRESGGPVSRKLGSDPGDCVHYKQGIYVCSRTRKVTCKKCSVELDPIQALSELAQNWDWEGARRAKRMAEVESARLVEEVKRLKSQRSRTRTAGYISVASVKQVLEDVAMRLRANAPKVKAGGWTVEAVANSAARAVDIALEKLLHGEYVAEQESADV